MHYKFQTSHSIGQGKHTLEVYLDYVCPFSKKIFETLTNTVLPHVQSHQPDLLKFVFVNQVQPWHPQSTICHEAALAVASIDPSKFIPYSKVLFDKQEQFFDINTYDKTRNQIAKELSELGTAVGIDPSQILNKLKYAGTDGQKNAGSFIVDDLKYFIKLGRARHIHVSPTCLVDDLEVSQISSSWQLDQWKEYLAKL